MKEKDTFTLTLLIIILAVSAVMFLVLRSPGVSSEFIEVSDVRIEGESPTKISFDLLHHFPEARECFANVSLTYTDGGVFEDYSSLGIIEPEQKVSKIISISFPPGSTDYFIDISCGQP